MPDFLDEFINTTVPELWDKVKDFVGESTTNEIIVAAAALVCIILAIAVHKANRRDRKYAARNQEQIAAENIEVEPSNEGEFVQVLDDENEAAETEQETGAAPENQSDIQSNSQSEAQLDDVPESQTDMLPNIETELQSDTQAEIQSEVRSETQSEPVNAGVQAAGAVENLMHPIVMEKIELKREEHHPSIMSYNTSRKGTTFTEEELIKIIKD